MIDTLILVFVLTCTPTAEATQPCAFERYETLLREASQQTKAATNRKHSVQIGRLKNGGKDLLFQIDSLFQSVRCLPQKGNLIKNDNGS